MILRDPTQEELWEALNNCKEEESLGLAQKAIELFTDDFPSKMQRLSILAIIRKVTEPIMNEIKLPDPTLPAEKHLQPILDALSRIAYGIIDEKEKLEKEYLETLSKIKAQVGIE